MAYPKRLFIGLDLSLANGWPNNQVVLPQITTQPTSQTIDEYSTATFTVVATGTAPLTYTWRKNGVIVGVNSASYSLITAATDNAAVITCTVSNSAGSVVSSNAVLTIQRNFTTFDPVLQTYMTMQTPKTFAGDFEINVEATFHPSQTNQQTIISGAIGSNNSIVIDKNLDKVRAFAFIGATITSIPTVTIPNDGKLHKIKLKYAGTVAYLSVDGGAEVPAIWGLNGSQNIYAIGVRSGGTNYFDGIIGSVTLTDLTNPSNSESWKLDKPIGTNTEQSSSGNNLLTYVNATKREKFTRVGNDWLGVDTPPTPINFLSGWAAFGGVGSVTTNSYTSTSTGGQGLAIATGKTGRHRLSYNITAGDVNWQIKDSSAGSGGDPNIVVASSASQSGVVNYTSVNGGVYIRHDVASGILVTVNSFKNQRLLEVA